MAMYDVDLVRAVQLVQTQRFCCVFDDSLKALLRTFADMLRAETTVMSSLDPREPLALDQKLEKSSAAPQSSRAKRKLQDAYSTEMDLDALEELGDEQRFDGRPGFAPFHDVGSG